MVGTFSGSSGGGLKIDRISIIFIKVKDELQKLTLNHKVYGIELIKKGFDQKELNSLYSLISLGSLFIIGTVVSMTLSGYPVFDSFIVSLAALTNSGEGFLLINGIELKKNSLIYLILNFLMIFGRFEVIGYLLIFQKFSIRN
jgi:trk system potassium uptake protein TrkH